MTPHWLEVVAVISLSASATFAVITVLDMVRGAKQHMWAAGFLTAYPTNGWLVKKGLKEKM